MDKHMSVEQLKTAEILESIGWEYYKYSGNDILMILPLDDNHFSVARIFMNGQQDLSTIIKRRGKDPFLSPPGFIHHILCRVFGIHSWTHQQTRFHKKSHTIIYEKYCYRCGSHSIAPYRRDKKLQWYPFGQAFNDVDEQWNFDTYADSSILEDLIREKRN